MPQQIAPIIHQLVRITNSFLAKVLSSRLFALAPANVALSPAFQRLQIFVPPQLFQLGHHLPDGRLIRFVRD